MTMTTSRGRAPQIAADKPDHWSERGTCRGMDRELFYPLGGHRDQPRIGANLRQEKQAKAVCNTRPCPVRSECLKWALDMGETWGVWGGLNEAERRDLSPAKAKDGRTFTAANQAKRAARTHCDRGHPLEGDNLMFTADGYRSCRACRTAKSRRLNEKRRNARLAVSA